MKNDLLFIAGLALLLILLNLAGLESWYETYPFVFILGGYFIGKYFRADAPKKEEE